jgi:hypothetical protein
MCRLQPDLDTRQLGCSDDVLLSADLLAHLRDVVPVRVEDLACVCVYVRVHSLLSSMFYFLHLPWAWVGDAGLRALVCVLFIACAQLFV